MTSDAVSFTLQTHVLEKMGIVIYYDLFGIYDVQYMYRTPYDGPNMGNHISRKLEGFDRKLGEATPDSIVSDTSYSIVLILCNSFIHRT